MKTRKLIGILLVLIMAAMPLFTACAAPALNATDTPAPSETAAPTASSIETPAPTETAEPTANSTDTPVATETPEPTPSETATPVINDGGPDVIGIYKRVSGGYQLLSGYNKKWVKGQDISDLYVIASDEDLIKGSSYEKIFKSRWNKYPDADKYKIGYCVSFTLKSSEVITLTIRSPKDAPKDKNKYFYQFIEVYLYDSLVPKDGPKRMHLVEAKMKPSTIITSIKLTCGTKISEVTSLSLTTFVYKDDSDFDPVSGKYIGNISYNIDYKQK